jgi:hypothetical protein
VLNATLNSLKNAGFENPHLFVDGCDDSADWAREYGLTVTARGGRPTLAFGNWVLALAELFIRHPDSTHFAVFQDDFLTYRNLRQYLERALYPQKCYLNLYTFPSNEGSRLREVRKPAPDDDYIGFYRSNGAGRGAVGLVFRRQAVLALLTHTNITERPLAVKGWKNLDGGVVTAMTKMEWEEYVHFPTLTYHTGQKSTIRNKPHHQGVCFLGEEYDALNLLTTTAAEVRATAARVARRGQEVSHGAG